MASLAADGYLHCIGGSIERPSTCFNLSYRQVRHHMDAVHAIDMGILHRASLHHGFCSAVSFLSRLEEQLHASMDVFTQAVKHLGSAQCHSNVCIMAASVHHPSMFRAEWATLRLRQRKSVHVCAQSNGFAGLSAFNQTDHPGTLCCVRNPDLIKRFVQATMEGWVSYLEDPTLGNELIQKDREFSEFFNWYDYFVETESYSNVYRFYQ